ncbi:MAG: hypothetical protein HF981_07940 [Desulfobacteraceae bacterium]|nr:hypothetical protein [Desulfobacteraceae bacterium]MBC2750299.1 hypothetical protein [Desulfobacteraceae bacterium]
MNDDEQEKAPYDIEDTLLLMRLFKTGDLFFVNPCIEISDDQLLSQMPYPVMVYTHTTNKYKLESDECRVFNVFASEILSCSNWSSSWFKTARRFFLYGGGKEYNPRHDSIDRVVDYITVAETILVPEKDFVGRRLRERAAVLLKKHDDISDVRNLLKHFYAVRSTVVHGGDISPFKDGILKRNLDFENVIRKLILEALRVFPAGDDRKNFLKQLFDICDKTRGEKVFNDFCAIKNENEKNRCYEKITKKLS